MNKQVEVSESVTGFSPIVQERIGWYVYLLRDPRDGEVFYVGKGKGNRVFAHARAALAQMSLTDEEQSQTAGLKFERIQEIHRSGKQVVTEILRHKIGSESAAYEVEGAVIDAFRAIGRPLANAVLGHHHELQGWASAWTVASIYDAEPIPEFDEPVVMLKLSRLWTPAMTPAEIFEATRGWWVVGERVRRARYAIAVSKKVTRAAYRIEYWRERVETDRDAHEDQKRKRLGFWGHETQDLDHLLSKDISQLRQAAGSPVVYVNLDGDGPQTPVYRGDDAVAKAAEEQARS